MITQALAPAAKRSEFASGWRIVAGSLLGISVGVSSTYFYSLGIFIKPIAQEYGLGRGVASLNALVGTAGAAVMALPTGRLVDRIGSLKVAIGSLCFLVLGFVLLGTLTAGLTSFLLLTCALSLLTAGSSPLPYTRLIVSAFDRRRGFALGVTLAGTGAGALIVPTVLSPLVAVHGWRTGYLTLAATIAIFIPAVWWFLAKAETISGATRVIPLAQLIRPLTFRLLAVIFFLASLAILGTLVQFVSMLTDWGMSPSRAGATAGLIGLSAICGRLLVGYLLDRLPPLLVTAGVFLVVASALVVLASAGATFAAPGALFLGFGVGAEVDLIAFLVGRYFSKALYGQTYGALYAIFLVGGAIGPAASGYLQQATGSYRLSLLCAACILVLAALSILVLGRAVGNPQRIVPATRHLDKEASDG